MTASLAVPGGDPAALRQLATQLRMAAEGSGNLGQSTTLLAGSITSDANWTGDGSTAFTAFTSNLSDGAGSAESPLTTIANAVNSYADVLETAQQKTQAYATIVIAAGNDPTGSMMSPAEAAGQSATSAIDALQEAGNQAAQQVTTAAGQLQVQNLFGTQGQVTGWASSQPALGTETLWSSGDPLPRIDIEKTPEAPDLGTDTQTTPEAPNLGTETETIPIGPDLGTGTETIPVAPGLGIEIEGIPQAAQGPLVNYDAVPGIDGTGKVHTGPEGLPGSVPPDWTPEDLEQLEGDLEKSIQTRQQEQQDLGEDGPHRARINQEIQLLKQVRKKLSGT
jgi:uncharacterized protein YukE